MTARNILDMLRKVENTIGICRNYDSLSKSRKILCNIRIVIEIVFGALVLKHIFIISQIINNRMVHVVQVFQIVSLFSGLIILICGILSSSCYELFIDNFMSVHHYFQNKPTYIKCSKKLKIVFVIITVVSCLSSTLIFATYLYIAIKAKNLSIWSFLVIISDVFNAERFILMNAVMHVYITMIQNFLKCLNESIIDFQVKYNDIEKGLCSDSKEWNDLLTVEQVELWATQFKCLMNCSRNLSVCFNVQMVFSLTQAFMHYLAASYVIFHSLTTDGLLLGRNQIGIALYFVSCSIFCTYFLMVAGQNLQNESSRTNRGLSKLYSTLSINPQAAETKALKKLIVFVQIHPIQIEYTSKVNLGMYLMPAIISLCMSYIITALQIDHFI